jgi:hypothetical protein
MRKSGHFTPKNQTSKDPALRGSIYHQQGKGFAAGGIVNATGGAGGGKGRLAKTRAARKIPNKTES